MQYRLGLDLGTNSIGWFITEIDKEGEFVKLIDGNSRIFSDGRVANGTSKAVFRREKRGARRIRDRKLQRMNALINFLTRNNFFPSDSIERDNLKKLDVYDLRKRAIKEKIEPFEIGRIFLNMAKRRGFKSNRKDNSETSTSDFKIAQSEFEKTIKESRSKTLGEYLSFQHVKRNLAGENKHPKRSMYLEEFTLIKNFQSKFYKKDNSFWDRIEYYIFFQRPLRSSLELVGFCTFIKNEKRAPRALPSFQRNRILQNISNLKVRIDGKLKDISVDEKRKIFQKLEKSEKQTFDQLRSLLSLPPDSVFNLESDSRNFLYGDRTTSKLKSKKLFGTKWLEFSNELKDEIIEKLLFVDEDHELEKYLSVNFEFLSNDQINEIISFEVDKKLEKSYGNISATALREINNYILSNSFCGLHDALDFLGYKDHQDVSKSSKLEYYGKVLVGDVSSPVNINSNIEHEKWGKISNPTVHIGLNQLRKVVNAILEKYGTPSEITVELSRELKMNKKQKDAYNKKLKDNKKINDEISEILIKNGVEVNRANLTKYKLWKELGPSKKCPFSGKKISLEKLFSHDIQIEHIIPFSISLDDSFSNKTLAFSYINEKKGNLTPFEAFGSEEGYKQNFDELPKYKQVKFFEDAKEKFLSEDKWLARQLNDTRYLSKVAKKYLSSILDPKKIYVSTGSMTASLRHYLGLNNLFDNQENKRDDHRHHAVDALVLSLMNSKILFRIRNVSKEKNIGKWKDLIGVWFKGEDIRFSAMELLKDKVVSYKPRHIYNGALFDENPISLLPEEIVINGKKRNSIVRKSLTEISDKKINFIKDSFLRDKILELKDLGKTSEEISKILKIKKLQVYESKNPVFIVKHGKKKEHEKALKMGTLMCLQVWKKIDGNISFQGVYLADFFNAKKDWNKLRDLSRNSNSRLVARIFKDDTVEYLSQSYKVTGIRPSKSQFELTPVNNPKLPRLYPNFNKFADGSINKLKTNILGL